MASPVKGGARELAAYAAGAARLPVGRPLAILGSPRSGTELFADLLASHPRARCDGEIFRGPRRFPLAYVSGKAAMARRRGLRVWSFKLLFHQLRWYEPSFGSAPEFLRRLHERGFTLLVLERRNRLLQTLSYLHGERAQYHFRSADQGDPRYDRMELDPAEVVASLHVFDDNARWGHDVLGDLPRIELTYEDDLAAPEGQLATAARVYEALGLDPHVPEISLMRVAPARARERVANYDDLAATLATTRFASFLDE